MSKNRILFCFTYAGGTSAFYNQLEEELAEEVEVVKLEYAGHGDRHREKLATSFEEVARDLYGTIQKILEERDVETTYALMGYSMGSIAVVEMLRQIASVHGMKMPTHIFLAAHEPINKIDFSGVPEEEIDEYVKKRTVQFGGIPETLLNNRSFWRVYLPIYKADYMMIGAYDFDSLDYRTDIPATVFYSETDTRFDDMKQWKEYFTGKCEFIEYDGNHFFINEHCREMASVIISRLEL